MGTILRQKTYLYIILVPPFPFLPTTEKHFVFTFGLIRITQLTQKDHPLFSAIILHIVVLPTCIITKPESSHCEPCHSVTKKVNQIFNPLWNGVAVT